MNANLVLVGEGMGLEKISAAKIARKVLTNRKEVKGKGEIAVHCRSPKKKKWGFKPARHTAKQDAP